MIRDDRLLFDSTHDQTGAMEKVYMDYVEGNFPDYGLHKEYASAFIEMMTRKLPGAQVLKCQVTGPVTFGMQVVDADKRPIYYDSQLADVLSKMIALKARWCEQEMKKNTGVSETLVVLNEPYLASLGSSVVPVDKETVRAGWEDIAALVEGGLGIHCCSNTDWEFVLGLEPVSCLDRCLCDRKGVPAVFRCHCILHGTGRDRGMGHCPGRYQTVRYGNNRFTVR